MPEATSRPAAPNEPSPATLDMQTRFVAITTNPIETLLPYVIGAIDTLGCGSAVVVRGADGSDSGLQLTLPLNFMNFLMETIHTYEGTSQAHPKPIKLTDFPVNIVYPPMIKAGVHAASVKVAIDAMGICPPDMQVAVVTLNQAGEGGLLISGPDDEKRKGFYNTHVLPTLQALASSLSPTTTV
jgi:hypothetical protein